MARGAKFSADKSIPTIITPADAPSAAASTRWFAKLVQNTSIAPKHVHMPAATTSPKARATFPSMACKTTAGDQATASTVDRGAKTAADSYPPRSPSLHGVGTAKAMPRCKKRLRDGYRLLRPVWPLPCAAVLRSLLRVCLCDLNRSYKRADPILCRCSLRKRGTATVDPCALCNSNSRSKLPGCTVLM